MNRQTRRERLCRLIRHRHVAVIGGRSATDCVRAVDHLGFAGPIWPINPRKQETGGHPVLANVEDLPEAPDATFLCVAAKRSIGMLAKLSSMGAGDMALIGPNGLGMINVLDGVVLWPDIAIAPRSIERGAVLITQNGSVSMNYALNQRDLPIAAIFSVGGQATCDVADIMSIMAEDERVTGFGLFLEGLGDIAAFSASVADAFARNLPVVAFKTGRSKHGRAFAQMHTASLATPTPFVDTLFERCGIVSADTLPQFDETRKVMPCSRRPQGSRVAVLTNSGGFRTLAADIAETGGIGLPSPAAR